MGGLGNQSLDSIFLARLKKTAAGFPKERNGPPPSDLDRLLAQSYLTNRAVRARGGSSLFSLVNGLHVDAMLDDSLSDTLGGMTAQAEAAYFATVTADIVCGRLIVREPINLLRCNKIPEIQALASAKQGLQSMAVHVRFAVKDSEARTWLDWHGLKIPDWLNRVGAGASTAGPSETPRWSDQLTPGQRTRKAQFDVIQDLIESDGLPAMAIPYGGVSDLEKACLAKHPEHFDRPTSFGNCWKDLKEKKLVRVDNYAAYCGIDESQDTPQ
ncbi:MAG: hypothetical protein ACD_23C01218G0001, partial [uncultured bacterium]